MTLRKKPLVVVGVIFGCCLAVLIAVPLLFKDRITERVRAEIDGAVDARVSWGTVGLTFFRDFPNLTLGVAELRVVGIDAFEGDTLASVGRLRFVLDVGSVVRSFRQQGPIVVRSIRIEEPVLRLAMSEDGTANWDIVRARPDGVERDEAAPRDVGVELRSFEVSDGTVVVDNARSGLYVSLEGLRYSLSGDFSRESLVARTRTRADRATVRFAGTPYLAGVALDFDAELAVDAGAKRVVFRENELRLNALVLRFSGEVARPGEDLVVDVAFETPDTEFRQMLSLVPILYARDFASLETTGTFAVEGEVRGDYGEHTFPSFAVTARVDDGSFRYPDLPLPARAIAADLSMENSGADLDSTVVNLNRFHVEIGDQPLDGAVTVRTPVSDPDVDVHLRGTLDLADLARTIKLDDAGGVEGSVIADATVRARLSDLDSARYDRVLANGTVAARNLTLTGANLRQPITVVEANIVLSPQRADLSSFDARLGSSDLQATGRLDNLLGFLLRDAPLQGTGTFASRYVNLDEWRSEDDLTVITVPGMLDLTLDGTVERLTYGTLEMTDARGSLRVQDQRLTLDRFTFATLGGRIGVTGHYETTDPAQPTFGVGVTLDSLDIAGASTAFLPVRTLAPVARYARGTFSADLDLSGALASDMTPVLDVLAGGGALLTSQLAFEDFPLLDRLSEALSVSRLADPTFDAVRSSIEIREGRLYVQPFRAGLGDLSMTVDGSNGIDQSLDYSLALALPRAGLGEAADRVVQDLATRAGSLGASFMAGDSVRVDVRVRGTVSDPVLDLGLGETVASVRALAEQAAGAAVDRQVEEAQARLDQAEEEARARLAEEEEEARRRAQARVDSLVAEAEEQAAAIRAEARRVADEVRAEGNRRADELLAQATNPLARRAAEPVADRIRQEAEDRADGIVREADERAAALVAEARRRAGGGQGV